MVEFQPPLLASEGGLHSGLYYSIHTDSGRIRNPNLSFIADLSACGKLSHYGHFKVGCYCLKRYVSMSFEKRSSVSLGLDATPPDLLQGEPTARRRLLGNHKGKE